MNIVNEKKTEQKNLEYWVGSTINPVEVGQTFGKIPLHMTILPWFKLSQVRREGFFESIEEMCERSHPFAIVGGERALFGPGKDIAVRRVISDDVVSFHFKILQEAEKSGAETNSPFIKDKFSAHITDKKEGFLSEGQSIAINSLQIFSRIPKDKVRTVEKVFKLGVNS